MKPEGVVSLGRNGLFNLDGQRIHETAGIGYWALPASKVLAVLPNPITDIAIEFGPRGRRLHVTTRFGCYRVIERNGRQWRVKKVPV